MILDIIAITISLISLLFTLFQEYRELFTIYWFSEYDIVLIPIDNSINPTKFISDYKKESGITIHLCQFKHQFIGILNNRYYYQTIEEYNQLHNESYDTLFQYDCECKNFLNIIKTHKYYKK